MENKIRWIIVTVVLLAGLTSCGTPGSQGSQGPSQNQPEAPGSEPYPAPVQGDLIDDHPAIGPDSSVSLENPYPEPLEPGKAEPGFSVVPSDYEYAPAPGDEELLRGNVFIDSGEILLLESYPVQVKIKIVGSLPTPCHQLRAIISPPDLENRIYIEAYSLSDPAAICTQVLEPIEAELPLGAFTEGDFRVFVNAQKLADFKLP